MDSEDINNIKTIIMPLDNKNTVKEIKTKKEKKDRVIIKEKKWMVCDDEYNSDVQMNILRLADSSDNTYNLMRGEIRRKISGYKSQDLKKNKYSEKDFIYIDFITATLLEKKFNSSNF